MAKRRVAVPKDQPRVSSEAIVARVYPLMQECVESGVKYGIHRIFKYRTTCSITEEQLLSEENVEQLLNGVMNEICERFDFPEVRCEL